MHTAYKNQKSERVTIDDNVRIIWLWWERVDSNHRSWKQQIYSLSPLATRELSHMKLCGAGGGVELVDGLEPPTCWLQISCSTNWATPARPSRLTTSHMLTHQTPFVKTKYQKNHRIFKKLCTTASTLLTNGTFQGIIEVIVRNIAQKCWLYLDKVIKW